MAVSTPLGTIALVLLCAYACVSARSYNPGDYVQQRVGGRSGTHVYDVIEPNDELKKLNFKTITTDNGLRAHSAIYAGGDSPTVDVIVAVTPVYAAKKFTCHLKLPNGEAVEASGEFTELANMLEIKGLTTGFIKCDLPASKDAPNSLHLSVEGSNVLVHSLQVKKITDDVE